MTKTNLITKSNAEINAMVVAYQNNPSDFLYSEIHEAVAPMAEKVAFKHYHKSKLLNISKDEYVQCAYIAIFKAVDAFDVSKGSHFTSLVKQLVDWTINDDIYKKANSQSNQFNVNTLSLDKPLSNEEGTFLDAIEEQYATDVDALFNDLIAKEEDESQSLTSILLGLVQDFSDSAKKEEITIIKTWVTTILSVTDASVDAKKLVNKALESVLPELSSATLRQKKSRAEKKFNKFAQEKGFSAFKLSHF